MKQALTGHVSFSVQQGFPLFSALEEKLISFNTVVLPKN